MVTRDFKKITNYIRKEFELFKTYYENLDRNVRAQFESNGQKSSLIADAIRVQKEGEINYVLRSLLREYIANIFNTSDLLNKKDIWIHLNELLDCLNSEKVFFFDTKNNDQFNFKLFYQEINSSSLHHISQIVRSKLVEENFRFE